MRPSLSPDDLLQLTDSDDASSQVEDITLSQFEALLVDKVGNKKTKSLIDPNSPGVEEPTGAMGEEAARTSGWFWWYHRISYQKGGVISTVKSINLLATL